MNIIVFTDEELKSLRMVLKAFYSKEPDSTTKKILDKIQDPKPVYEYTKGKSL